MSTRVLFISSVFPPDIGGPSQQSASLTQELAAQGLSVNLLLPEGKRVPVSRPRLLTRVVRDVGRGGRAPVWKLLRLVNLFQFFCASIARVRPIAIHIQVFGDPFGLMAILAARLMGVPILVKLTGEKHVEWAGEHGEGGWRVVLLRGLDWAQLHAADRVWTTSPQFQVRLRREYNLSRKQVLMLPNFIELEGFEAVAARRTKQVGKGLQVLCVARLRPWKGLEHTLRACALAGDAVAGLTIVGCGSEDYLAALKRLAVRLGIDSRVSFRPAVAPDAIASTYGSADVFILLSDYEPFGIVLVEAMAAGLPVIATHTGGIPSVLGELGPECMVAPGDADAAGKLLIELSQSSERIDRLVVAGRRRARRFDLASGARRLHEAYIELGGHHCVI